MFKEFKEFALRGSLIDMAVGIIIGGAFGKIVSSLVNDVFMPVIGLIIGSDFSNLKYVITPASGDIAEHAIYYGQFIQTMVDFLIIAAVLFIVIKAINRLRRNTQKEKPAPAPPPPTKEEILLAEIRDLLKK